MKVYAFVPAKGTSERVENKNMRFLDGERLYVRALKTLLRCKEIDKVFLDTESEEMYSLCDYLPIQFMKRDPALANNRTDGHRMFMNEVETNPDADIYVQMLCTSPFISPETIDSVIRDLKADDSHDSAILMRSEKCYGWKDGRPEYDIDHIPNSKDLPPTITESMGLYVQRRESALRTRRRYGDTPLFVYAAPAELVDVNTPEDLTFAEIVAKGFRSAKNRRLEMVKHLLTSPAISDVLDDLKVELGEDCGAVLSGWTANAGNRRIIGRASTLRLRRLKPGEDFNGIYKALESYKGMTDNSIICVENEIPECAYFGGLNARLAIRAGAVAAIIDGKTRDATETAQLNFPVYSRGYNAQDVRRRATVDYVDKPVCIGGAKISPGDLVFIDDCAVVVIYQKHEEIVLNRVCATFENETNISSAIFAGESADALVKKYGAF